MPILQDTLDELDETFFVNLTSAVNASIADAQGIGTIVDDEGAVTLSINDLSVDESSGTANFTVTLSAASGQDISVTAATANDTATAGADYAAVSATVLNIAAGATTASFSVPILPDTLDELDETFFVNLTAAVNASIADNQGLGTIIDDDPTPTLSIDDVTVDEATATADFTVTLSAAGGQDVSVTVSTVNGTATAGTDYNAVISKEVTIPAGSTSAKVSVTILEDELHEVDQTYFVNLSSPVNASIGDGQGLGTITDNDNATITVSIAEESISESGGRATATVSRNDEDISVPLDVTLTISHPTEAILIPASVTIPAGSSSVEFFVEGVPDQVPGDTVMVTVTASTTNPHDPGTDTVVILDDDATEVCTAHGVELRDGTLVISGTEKRDQIIVSRNGSRLRVRIKFAGEKWVTTMFKYSAVTSIVVEACDGNDQVQIDRRVEQETTIAGGPGNDNIRTGDGDATVDGGQGNDFIWTGDGKDTVTDPGGRNTIRTGNGDDTVRTGKGNDLILTGKGHDTIEDGGGVNAIYAGDGNNIIVTGDGRDFVITGNGIDSIATGGGGDIVYAGGGNDNVDTGAGADRVYAGNGDDIVRGGSDDDRLYGDDGNDILLGEDGNDRLYGLAGRDLLIGGLGSDILEGGRQDDILIGAVVTNNDDKDLEAILDIWTSNTRYLDRVNKLRADGGLLNLATVDDDGERDLMRGDRGRDWFFANLKDDKIRSGLDKVQDKSSNEDLEEL